MAANDEAIITGSLWKPAGLVAVEVAFLVHVHRQAKEVLENAPDNNAAGVNPFADSWLVPVIMNSLYLTMIFVGKRLMRDRKPFEIRTWMFAYNLFQAVMNLVVVIAFIYEVRSTGMPIWCSGIDRSKKGLGIGFWIYVHYHNKYLEYADTLFMVLRRKFNQISFLHVYHHSLLTCAWWAVTAYAPGGDAYFGATYNSFIHVLMYSYYLCSLFSMRCPWKKYLTQMQMIQFVICFSQTVYLGVWGEEEIYPFWLVCLQAFVMLNMLVLFGNFYIQSYKKKGADTKAKSSQPPPCEASAQSPPASPLVPRGGFSKTK
mmetsp:Transcript_150495/g.262981  ORF Transcript_150495/g.262981 Transcript_150495/m.262981 type:complete len:316 (-) Transcript_150495:2153-3100(-)